MTPFKITQCCLKNTVSYFAFERHIRNSRIKVRGNIFTVLKHDDIKAYGEWR